MKFQTTETGDLEIVRKRTIKKLVDSAFTLAKNKQYLKFKPFKEWAKNEPKAQKPSFLVTYSNL